MAILNGRSSLYRIYGFFLILLLIAVTFLLKPSGYDFGDQATENIFFHETLRDFKLNNYSGSYTDYVKNKNLEVYSLVNEADKVSYGIQTDGVLSLLWKPEHAKVLYRMVVRFLDVISLQRLNLGYINLFFSFSFFVGTLIFAFKFARIFFEERSAFLVSIAIGSSTYLMQLHSGVLEPQLLVYPGLVLAYLYIFNLIHTDKIGLFRYFVWISLILTMAMLNGYPNTQFVLPILVLFHGLRVFQKQGLKRGAMFYLIFLLAFLLATAFGVLGSYGYSYYLQEPNSVSLAGQIGRIKTILSILLQPGVGDKTLLDSFFTIAFNLVEFLKQILTTTPLLHSPHEPGMLLGYRFLNGIEIFGLLCLIGLKVRDSDLFSYLKFLLLFVLIRAAFNANVLVDKSSHDYFFIVQLISWFSLLEVWRKYHIDMNCIRPAWVLGWALRRMPWIQGLFTTLISSLRRIPGKFYVLTSLVFCINVFTYTSKFLYAQDENLGEFRGLVDVRDFIQKNSDLDTLIVYQYYHGSEISPYRLNFLNKRLHWMPLAVLSEKFRNQQEFLSHLEKNHIGKVIFITRGTSQARGPSVYNFGFHEEGPPGANNFFHFLAFDKTFPNNLGGFSYLGYVTNTQERVGKFELIQEPFPDTNVHQISIREPQFLESLAVPGAVKFLRLICSSGLTLDWENKTNDRSMTYLNLNNGIFRRVHYLDFSDLNAQFGTTQNARVLGSNEYGYASVAHLEQLRRKKLKARAEWSIDLPKGTNEMRLQFPYVFYNDLLFLNKLDFDLEVYSADGDRTNSINLTRISNGTKSRTAYKFHNESKTPLFVWQYVKSLHTDGQWTRIKIKYEHRQAKARKLGKPVNFPHGMLTNSYQWNASNNTLYVAGQSEDLSFTGEKCSGDVNIYLLLDRDSRTFDQPIWFSVSSAMRSD